jgi:hypothetical protein
MKKEERRGPRKKERRKRPKKGVLCFVLGPRHPYRVHHTAGMCHAESKKWTSRERKEGHTDHRLSFVRKTIGAGAFGIQPHLSLLRFLNAGPFSTSTMARGVGNKPIKASSSLKSSIPIPLHHDGPIYHGLKSNQVTGE